MKLPEATLYSADLVIEKGDKQLHSKGKYEILGYKFEEETEIKGTHMKLTVVQKNGSYIQALLFTSLIVVLHYQC